METVSQQASGEEQNCQVLNKELNLRSSVLYHLRYRESVGELCTMCVSDKFAAYLARFSFCHVPGK